LSKLVWADAKPLALQSGFLFQLNHDCKVPEDAQIAQRAYSGRASKDQQGIVCSLQIPFAI
jgi:hypothetical protein